LREQSRPSPALSAGLSPADPVPVPRQTPLQAPFRTWRIRRCQGGQSRCETKRRNAEELYFLTKLRKRVLTVKSLGRHFKIMKLNSSESNPFPGQRICDPRLRHDRAPHAAFCALECQSPWRIHSTLALHGYPPLKSSAQPASTEHVHRRWMPSLT